MDLPSETNTTTVAILVAKDAGRAHLVRNEELGEVVLVHRLWQVRDVQVGVLVVSEGLELGVERLLSRC